jgi:nucleoside-diphosphate-sugar epimerase
VARYFVTGATGFLGGELVKQLVGRGHKVSALVRSPDKAALLKTFGVELHQGDIVDRATLAGPMAGADGVFHVAGWYRLGVADPAAGQVNVEGTRNVLDTMRELGVPAGVYTSTIAVFSDTRGAVPDEHYRYGGPWLSEYERTKWRAHYEVALPMIAAGLPLRIAMPGVTYGPGDTSGLHSALVDLLRRRLLATPRRTAFCWAHVEDIARGHILAMEKGGAGETYILTGPRHTFQEAFDLAATLARVRKPLLHPGPSTMRGLAALKEFVARFTTPTPAIAAEGLRTMAGTTYFGDNSKAVAELGFSPRPLMEGLEQTIEHELRKLGRS